MLRDEPISATHQYFQTNPSRIVQLLSLFLSLSRFRARRSRRFTGNAVLFETLLGLSRISSNNHSTMFSSEIVMQRDVIRVREAVEGGEELGRKEERRESRRKKKGREEKRKEGRKKGTRKGEKEEKEGGG